MGLYYLLGDQFGPRGLIVTTPMVVFGVLQIIILLSVIVLLASGFVHLLFITGGKKINRENLLWRHFFVTIISILMLVGLAIFVDQIMMGR